MQNNVLAQLAALQGKTTPELKQMWSDLYGKAPTTHSRDFLIKRLAYRIQELAYGGLFGAAALLLPMLFHLLHLGAIFLPMYLPLVLLPFYVSASTAAVTALLIPLLSGALTGMPPLYPPVGPIMGLEIALMAAIIAVLYRRRPDLNVYLLLVPVLLLGRLVHLGLIYALALFIDLPAAFVAGASVISGWPGLILIIGGIVTGLHEHRNKPGRSRIGRFVRSFFAQETSASEGHAFRG